MIQRPWIKIFTVFRVGTRRYASATGYVREQVPEVHIKNEPVLQYLKNSKERGELEAKLKKYASQCVEIPIVIGSEEIYTGDCRYQVMPFDHKIKIAKYHLANKELIEKAIQVSLQARQSWESTPLERRINLFLAAADLVSGKYRMDMNATTMLGQGKTAVQAEIDAAAEFTDFLRFNARYATEMTKFQPVSENSEVTLNSLRFRGLEGFVAAVSPFNFTAIGGNLSSAPALMGNVVLWKPSDTAMLSSYTAFRALKEVLPPGVINFIPCDGPVFGDTIVSSPHLTGINFTGSVPTFQRLWRQVGENIAKYKSFPRLVGECGGKNYHFIHPSAEVDTVVASTIRAAFEYSGQKCSACSRLYAPESLWNKIKSGLLEIHKQLKVGSPVEFDTFMSAVIDGRSFDRIKGYLDHAKSSPNLTVLAGGTCDDSVGYYVQPTIVQTTDPIDRIMTEEIFGPVLTVYVYPDSKVDETLKLVSESVPFGLTGAIFGKDQKFLRDAVEKLKMSAGNFYINDKSTGAVVGQQPFGGARVSGTNDKAGGPHYLLKWTNPQSIKETFVPLKEWKYKYMEN